MSAEERSVKAVLTETEKGTSCYVTAASVSYGDMLLAASAIVSAFDKFKIEDPELISDFRELASNIATIGKKMNSQSTL